METVPQEEEGWELRHDEDGFIYKILKRRNNGPTTDDPSPPNLEAQENQRRRERKRRTLLKLKSRYQKEIDHWGILSDTMREMQDKAHREMESRRRRMEEAGAVASSLELPPHVGKEAAKASGSVIEELLSQTEAQEALIRKVSNLCDLADAICNAQEERLAQSFIDLPIWSSPRELMASLCTEQVVCPHTSRKSVKLYLN